MSLDTSNKLFQLAADIFNHSSQNIFLTCKAGTGKTTFLKYIKPKLTTEISFGEIQPATAWKEFQKEIEKNV